MDGEKQFAESYFKEINCPFCKNYIKVLPVGDPVCHYCNNVIPKKLIGVKISSSPSSF